MICRVADLTVEIPAAGGMAARCGAYACEETTAQIVLREEQYRLSRWPGLTYEEQVYLETGYLFYRAITDYGGMMLHASAVEYGGRAYLFSGPCGMGKSTHTRLWQAQYGAAVKMINDDKPALRRLDGLWYAYGTPWCGKEGLNRNCRVPLGGICFLERGELTIRRLSVFSALRYLVPNAPSYRDKEAQSRQLQQICALAEAVPMYALQSHGETDAAILAKETMLCTQ